MKKTNVKKKSNSMHYGNIAFGIGMLISLVAPFLNLGATSTKVVIITLIIIGLIVGFLNITYNEAVSFMVASITLVILLGPFLGLVSQYFFQSGIISKIFGNVVAFIVPAAIFVALRTIFVTAKDE